MTTLTATRPPTHPASAGEARTHEPAALSISPFGPPQQTPCSAHELAFRRRLVELGGHRKSDDVPRRCFVSALVGALRGGNTADRVLSIAAGITPDDLLAAYDHLDGRRRTACDALDVLFADPTRQQFQAVAPSAHILFPRLIESLTATAQVNRGRFPAAVHQIESRMIELALEVEQIEHAIETGAVPARSALARLDDGRHVGVHHDPAYRPTRVGDMTPQRIAALLDESIEVVRR